MHKDVKEILFTMDQITDKCKELGEIISKDYEGKEPVLLGLLKGSVPFMAELSKYLTMDLSFDFMHVSSYVGALSGQLNIKKDIEHYIPRPQPKKKNNFEIPIQENYFQLKKQKVDSIKQNMDNEQGITFHPKLNDNKNKKVKDNVTKRNKTFL